MSHNNGHFKKGQSGNAAGRPPAGRALAAVLRDHGEHDSFADLPNQNMLAQNLWHAITFGEIKLLGGKTYELSLREWFDLVKWVTAHVDGTYRVNMTDSPPAPIDPKDFFIDPYFRGSGVYRMANRNGDVRYDRDSLYLLKKDGFIHRSELETGQPLLELIQPAPDPDSDDTTP